MDGMTTAISWSGGKDSALALIAARAQGLCVRTFVTACRGHMPAAHALPATWFARQVAALGGEWLPFEGGADYAQAFDAVLRDLAGRGHRAMVFGDIDLAAHRDWIEPRVRAAGLQPLFPLWGLPRGEVARRILEAGIRARVVTVDLAKLPADVCGRAYDADLLAELPPSVCPCGEDGEFHTAVESMPGMREPVPLVVRGWREIDAQPPLRPGRLAQAIVDEESAAGAGA
jgi:diphthamide synthase (EF-2-diphthine--ammonia ligase)